MMSSNKETPKQVRGDGYVIKVMLNEYVMLNLIQHLIMGDFNA